MENVTRKAPPAKWAIYRALLRKEWKQARVLTAVGAGLGFLVPPVLLLFAGEDGSAGGWRAYDAHDVFATLCPLLYVLALWPLWALMASVQVFSADRAAGTERFLLDRPVPRTRVWLVRLATAAGSLLAVMAASGLGWWLFGDLLGGTALAGSIDKVDWLGGNALALLALALGLLLASGVFAAACGARSFGGVLLGATVAVIIAAALLELAATLWVIYRQALVIGPLWAIATLLAAGWLMLCRGEPAGRGRWLRGGAVLLGAAVGAAGLVLAVAPLAIEWKLHGLSLPSMYLDSTSYSGVESFFLPSREARAGWLLDAKSGERKRFFSDVSSVAFSSGGGKIAVATGNLPVGIGEERQIGVYDARSGRLVNRIPLGEEVTFSYGLFWRAEKVLFTVWLEGKSKSLFEADLTTGELRQVVAFPVARASVVHSRDGSRVFLVFSDYDSGVLRIVPVDVEQGALGDALVLPGDRGGIWLAHHSLSREGTFWLSELGESRVEAIDLDRRETVLRLDGVVNLAGRCWLGDETLAWVGPAEQAMDGGGPALHLWDPRQGRRQVHRWARQQDVVLVAEPRGERLLMLSRGHEVPASAGFEEVVLFDPRDGSWRLLPVQRAGRNPLRVIWGTSSTLALLFEDGVFRFDLEGSGPPRLLDRASTRQPESSLNLMLELTAVPR